MKTFAGACLKPLLLLCLFFSFTAFAAEWPEFNPEDKGTVAFYLTQADALCIKMQGYQDTYDKHSEALASDTKTNPFHQYEDKWLSVWRAYSKHPYNREREMGLSLENFGTVLIAKLTEMRADLKKKKKGNQPFPREMVQKVTAYMRPHFDSPAKIFKGRGRYNTWALPKAIPGTCAESPEKKLPSKSTPPGKNSNMVRMGLGMVPWVDEKLPSGENKYHCSNAHHMGQKNTDETVVFLNYGIHTIHTGVLHGTVKESKIKRGAFDKERAFMAKVFAARRTRKWLLHLMEQFNAPAIPAPSVDLVAAAGLDTSSPPLPIPVPIDPSLVQKGKEMKNAKEEEERSFELSISPLSDDEAQGSAYPTPEPRLRPCRRRLFGEKVPFNHDSSPSSRDVAAWLAAPAAAPSSPPPPSSLLSGDDSGDSAASSSSTPSSHSSSSPKDEAPTYTTPILSRKHARDKTPVVRKKRAKKALTE